MVNELDVLEEGDILKNLKIIGIGGKKDGIAYRGSITVFVKDQTVQIGDSVDIVIEGFAKNIIFGNVIKENENH